VLPLGVREPDDFNEAFATMDRDPPDAILMVTDSLTLLNRKRVFESSIGCRSSNPLRSNCHQSGGCLKSIKVAVVPSPTSNFQRLEALLSRMRTRQPLIEQLSASG
jgi:hypothetical protein